MSTARLITEEERKLLYNNGKGLDYKPKSLLDGLVAYWMVNDDGTITDLLNRSLPPPSNAFDDFAAQWELPD